MTYTREHLLACLRIVHGLRGRVMEKGSIVFSMTGSRFLLRSRLSCLCSTQLLLGSLLHRSLRLSDSTGTGDSCRAEISSVTRLRNGVRDSQVCSIRISCFSDIFGRQSCFVLHLLACSLAAIECDFIGVVGRSLYMPGLLGE